MTYKVGDIEPINGDNYMIMQVIDTDFGDSIKLIHASILLKSGGTGKRNATFFSDKRVTSLKIYSGRTK